MAKMIKIIGTCQGFLIINTPDWDPIWRNISQQISGIQCGIQIPSASHFCLA